MRGHKLLKQYRNLFAVLPSPFQFMLVGKPECQVLHRVKVSDEHIRSHV